MANFVSNFQAYSGKKNVEKGTVPNKCQSLHHSHISFGTSTSMDLKTQTTNSFNRKTLIPVSTFVYSSAESMRSLVETIQRKE